MAKVWYEVRRLDKCGRCSLSFLLLFNLLIFLLSGCGIALGTWHLVDHAKVNELMGTNLLMSTVYVLLFIFLVSLVISYLGCSGAREKSYNMLLSYACITLILFLLMMVSSIVTYYYGMHLIDLAEQRMRESMANYKKRPSVTQAWDDLQYDYNCCGTKTSQDWMNYNYSYPDSCCGREVCTPQTAKAKQGCLSKVVADIHDHVAIICGVALATASLMILCIVLACYLTGQLE